MINNNNNNLTVFYLQKKKVKTAIFDNQQSLSAIYSPYESK